MTHTVDTKQKIVEEFIKEFVCKNKSGIEVVAKKFGDGELLWKKEALVSRLSSSLTQLEQEMKEKIERDLKKLLHDDEDTYVNVVAWDEVQAVITSTTKE
jgi:hypothetical protein